MIDLSMFDLTTPAPKPGATTAWTVSGADIDKVSQFAYYDLDDLMLWASTSGAATESVHRTRCELKGAPFYLADAAMHRAAINVKVEKVNWYGEFVALQAHCDDGNDPTEKTFVKTTDGGKTGTISAGIRQTAATTEPKKVAVYTGIDLTRAFRLKLELTNASSLTLTVTQDRTETLTVQLDADRAARPHVFHMGAYNQIDQGNAKEPVGDGTLVRLIDGPAVFHGTDKPPVLTVADYNALIDAAIQLKGSPMKVELQRITDLIDDSDLSDAEQAPLYTRIKAAKK